MIQPEAPEVPRNGGVFSDESCRLTFFLLPEGMMRTSWFPFTTPVVLAFSLLSCGADPEAAAPVCHGPADCPVEHGECRVYAGCQDSACVFVDVVAGGPTSAQTPGDCAAIVCDGEGGVIRVPADDPPDDGNGCTRDACDGFTPTHTPIPEYACYTGPAGTRGVGLCEDGVQRCDAQGNEVGPCKGQVTPAAEVCEAIGTDEDCDGAVNEKDACCGDGKLAYGEPCDDGNADAHDGCTPICEPPKCGDGFVHPELGESCDGEPTCTDACIWQTVVFVASSTIHTCAGLHDGRLKCWGSNHSGVLGLGDRADRGNEMNEMGAHLPAVDLGPGRTAKVVACGGMHTCAILDDGHVKCWGLNADGVLGLGILKDDIGAHPGEMGAKLPPIDLGAGRTAKAISAGHTHTCAILDDDRVKCWGLNFDGRLGLKDAAPHGETPSQMGDNLPAVDLGTGRTAKAISAGETHTCAILDDDRVKCWGLGGYGRLGGGNQNDVGGSWSEMGDSLAPVDLGVGRTAVAIAAGVWHTCAILDDARVKCWGRNDFGQLGLGDTKARGDEPGEMGDALPAVDLGAGAKAVAISVAGMHTCALLDSGALKCWGRNTEGYLGLGDLKTRGKGPGEMGDALPAVDLGAGVTAVALTTGLRHSCALLDDGSVKCWGNADAGQLGSGDTITLGDEAAEMGDGLPRVRLFSDVW